MSRAALDTRMFNVPGFETIYATALEVLDLDVAAKDAITMSSEARESVRNCFGIQGEELNELERTGTLTRYL